MKMRVTMFPENVSVAEVGREIVIYYGKRKIGRLRRRPCWPLLVLGVAIGAASALLLK
jgi:hypothetical protein